jgi:hypothetical protein
MIIPYPQPQLPLPLIYPLPAFRPKAAPRKTGVDYDNEQVRRHLNMLTAERPRLESSGPSVVASPLVVVMPAYT